MLYWEHITPNEVVWKRICFVYKEFLSNNIEENCLRDNIKKCFTNHRLVLLTKSESDNLDKKGGRTGNLITNSRDDQGILQSNIAEQRISLLFTDDCGVNSLYLNNEPLKQADIFDENYNFSEKVKSYFSNDLFVINSTK